jgi:hypothetical protein
MLCLSAWAWAMAGLSSTVRVECARVAGCVRLLRSILSQFLHCAWLRAPLLRRAVCTALLGRELARAAIHARTATLEPTVSSFF